MITVCSKFSAKINYFLPCLRLVLINVRENRLIAYMFTARKTTAKWFVCAARICMQLVVVSTVFAFHPFSPSMICVCGMDATSPGR